MTIWKHITVAVTLALTGKKALAVGATSALAGVTAVTIGADPIPWLIGGAGATVTYSKLMPETRLKAISNGIIGVFCGGLFAPFISSLIALKIGPEWTNDYVMAFTLSAGWPWLIPMAVKFADKKWLGGKGVSDASTKF